MKVSTRNTDRTMSEMYEMWHWLTRTFGPPAASDCTIKRWTYGKEIDVFGHAMVSGPFEIEWIDFADEKDAVFFELRWS